MEALGPLIDQARSREGAPPESLDALERLRAVLTLIGKRLAGLDPDTAIPQPLDAISSAIQAATAELSAFANDGDTARISNANIQADAALQHLAVLVLPTTPEELSGLQAAAAGYRDSLELHLRHAGERVATVLAEATVLADRLAAVGQDLVSEKQKVLQLTSDFQAQFSSAQISE